ncbi:hypothetical protein FHS15_003208 [Paenibacillus castaneae]|uniref:cellulase family glycosylhydrolase n=1 Tax=Paenibacillus castaneae TaxID=474957 RepID=UPI00141BAD44|nr:cellulase family glycosylhydrolase [Paenibacillus castaneae]NIK78070.1 hypothetical protein [Paenibacillus castaneae]
MTITNAIKRYDRWTKFFVLDLGVESVVFSAPSGHRTVRSAFLHQPANLVYDDHGYERIVSDGDIVIAVRFTPTELGTYGWKAFNSNQEVVEKGELECETSNHPGFVVISERDGRYFECSNGEAICVFGINLCSASSYPLSEGKEFQISDQFGTLGLLDYNRWFHEFSENGGNFVRLWLSSSYFEPETGIAGDLDLVKLARLDQVVELARVYGIRLKFCLEHFRTLDPFRSEWSNRVLEHPLNGKHPKDMDDWFTNEEWQSLWWRKVEAYVARYGDDPVVMAWELWNEINACSTSSWSILRDWTKTTASKLQPLVPNQLVVNSLGSFDKAEWKPVYDDFHMDQLAFQQVHRYLDQGAELDICHQAFRLGVDAVQQTKRKDRPVLLAETGAVNDCHTGPFRWYRADHQGVIFHDTVYPALFAGAAGPGQIWHWDEYVDKNNLWHLFRPLHKLMDGIDLPSENFVPFELTNDQVWLLGLSGKNHLIGLARSRGDDWQRLFIQGIKPQKLEGLNINLSEWSKQTGHVQFISPWHDGLEYSQDYSGTLAFPDFEISSLFKIQYSNSI